MVRTLGTISFALNPKRAHFVIATPYSMLGLASRRRSNASGFLHLAHAIVRNAASALDFRQSSS